MEDENIESAKTKAKDLLKCGLCCQTYDTPRCLPCAHSFCHRCLQGYISSLQAKSTFHLGSFQCPMCQMLIGLPHGGVAEFPLDARIRDIRETAVAEMKDILLKKLLSQRRNSVAESSNLDYSETESQTSDASSREAGSNNFEDDQSLHTKPKRYFERYQSFTNFDTHQKNSETADKAFDRPRLNRIPSRSASLREIHRRKAQDLMAAFDNQSDFTSANDFAHPDSTSRDHSAYSSNKSGSDLFRRSTSRYRTHQGDNVHKEFSGSNVGSSYDKYDNASSEDIYEKPTRSSFLGHQYGYQSLRETSSRKPYVPSAESIFHGLRDHRGVDCKNDVQSEFDRLRTSSGISENELKHVHTATHQNTTQRKEFDSDGLETVPEIIAFSPFDDSANLSANDFDSRTVSSSSVPVSSVSSKRNDNSSRIKRKSSSQTRHTTVFESVLAAAEEERSHGQVGQSENSGQYKKLSKHYQNTFSSERSVPKVVISEPVSEVNDTVICNIEKQCTDSEVYSNTTGTCSEISGNEEERNACNKLLEREVLQEFDFLLNDDEGIELDSERSDSVASINIVCADTNYSELFLGAETDISARPDYPECPQRGDGDELPDNKKQNDCANEECEVGMYQDASENVDSSDNGNIKETLGSESFVSDSGETSSQFDNFKSKTESSRLNSSDKYGVSDGYHEHSDVVDSGTPTQKNTSDGTALLHHVSVEEYLMPTAVAILSQGNTVVADYGVGCLQYYTDDGSPLHKIDGIKPFSIAVNPVNNQVIVGDRRKKTICVFDECGCDVAQWDANMFKWICGIGILRNGDLVILDREKSQFGIYKPDGQLVYAFGSYGNDEKQICMGEFLVVDGMDRIVTCDSGNHCVKIFSITGSLLQKFSDRGEADGELQWPKGICTDEKNNIIVADSRNSRISMFSSNGSFVQHLVTNLTLPYAVSYSNPSIAVTMYSIMGQSRFHLYDLYHNY